MNNIIGLWRTDGTTVSNVLNATSMGLTNLSNFIEFNGNLYFTAADSTNGNELRRFDGTTTYLVSDINPTGSSSPYYLNTNGKRLYFMATNDGTHYHLWETDGSQSPAVSGTDPTDVTQNSVDIYTTGANVYIRYNTNTTQQLWVDDSSLHRVADLTKYGTNSSLSYPYNFVTVNNDLYFLADDGNGGTEIWLATGPNKTRVTDINTTGNGNNLYLIAGYNGYAYFSRHSTVINDDELWRTNGTITEPVHETATGNSIIPFNPLTTNITAPTVIFNNALYCFGHSVTTNTYVLYRVDGTTTQIVATLAPITASLTQSALHLAVLNGSLYFSALDQTTGTELWRTNGMTTSIVKDINTTGSSSPEELTAAGKLLYFTADDGVNGRVLWQSDGSTTTMVTDANGKPFSNVNALIGAANSLYFSVGSSASGTSLWHTDGAVPLAIDLSHMNTVIFINNYSTYGDYLIIHTAFDAWITNGGPLLNLANGAINTPQEYAGWLYYGDYAGLFRTNGSVVEPVSYPNFGFRYDANFAVVNNLLFFAGGDESHGQGLWYTDGSTLNRVDMPNPSGQGVYIDSIIGASNQIYFLGSNALFGTEFWVAQIP
ncbi:MAG: PQQ-binding-like beta-propeller repeat protein [Gammaproteobacteria bacterium]|nr:PQQ-binding-like beta-propeller repeat protein [Gammaproteobacteria bacterium]